MRSKSEAKCKQTVSKSEAKFMQSLSKIFHLVNTNKTIIYYKFIIKIIFIQKFFSQILIPNSRKNVFTIQEH